MKLNWGNWIANLAVVIFSAAVLGILYGLIVEDLQVKFVFITISSTFGTLFTFMSYAMWAELEKEEKIMIKNENVLFRLLSCYVYQWHIYETMNSYNHYHDKMCVCCGHSQLNATKRILYEKKIKKYENDKNMKLIKFKEKYYNKLPTDVKVEYFTEKL